VLDDVPSRTAAWVAVLRGLGRYLPPHLQLVDDPFGLRFAADLALPRVGRGLAARTRRWWMRGRIARSVVSMQLRSRALDEAVVDFVKAGGAQVVLLGAGYDCRAWRLLGDDRRVTVFEVDHPATQRRKRERMEGEPGARVRFLPWNFEREPLSLLPDRLEQLGFDRRAPSVTVLEGVTTYLTPAAIEETFGCVASYSAPGSRFAFTYVAAALLVDSSTEAVLGRRVLRMIGEPFRFGFDPDTLEAWLAVRRLRLERNESFAQIARRLLPQEPRGTTEGGIPRRSRYVAVASSTIEPDAEPMPKLETT
jgi:methyltransferase (TIGR00027 family)